MYPITFQADYAGEGRNRLTVFFRYFCLIPLAFVSFFWTVAAYLTVAVAWLVVVFTARYPAGLYEFNSSILRFFTRYNAYSMLLTDSYPPFGGSADDAYPIRVGIAPRQESYSRLKVFFRGLLAFPMFLIAAFYGLGAFLVTTLAWFVLLFTGRHPEGMFGFVRNYNALSTRLWGYELMLTDAYPSISDEPQVAAATPGT